MKNKGIILILGVILTINIIIAGFLFTNRTTPLPDRENIPQCPTIAEHVTISMDSEGFAPDEVTIPVCTEVTFQNEDENERWPASDLHPTHGMYPEFDPLQGIEPGKSWSFVFDKEGSWKFHDHLFPSFRGVITVTTDIENN